MSVTTNKLRGCGLRLVVPHSYHLHSLYSIMSSPQPEDLQEKPVEGNDDPMQGVEQEEEGEGDEVMPNMTDDSSEEGEDDEEEARRIREGFIVDEDEEEEDEEEERRRRRKKRKKHHRRRKFSIHFPPFLN